MTRRMLPSARESCGSARPQTPTPCQCGESMRGAVGDFVCLLFGCAPRCSLGRGMWEVLGVPMPRVTSHHEALECPNVNSITLFSSVIELTLRNVNNSRNFHNTCLTLRSGNNIQLTLSLCNNTYLRSASLTNTCCSLATSRAPMAQTDTTATRRSRFGCNISDAG